VLVLLGQVLELRAREKTSGAIKALLGLAPKTAVRVQADGSDETVPVDCIQVADLLRVRPGEKVTVDGELTVGCQRALRDRRLLALVRRPRTLARRRGLREKFDALVDVRAEPGSELRHAAAGAVPDTA
jgi:hypothetical protein